MKPNTSLRSAALTRIATALLVASTLHGATASAASFQYRHPIMGMVASPTTQAQQVATEILVALTGGPTLPAGEVNWPYSYDLKQLLSVTGDSAYNASGVTWSLSSGALPAGLSLGGNGVISGTPTTKDAVGSSFQVSATYKAKTGQQAYTIVVNGAVLHVTQISAGREHSCAVTTSGGVKCWGSDVYGQLGNDAMLVNKPTPVDVQGLTSDVISVSAGQYHTCALTRSGGAKCWGLDNGGQLGNDASVVNQPTPVDVRGLTSGVTSIFAGGYYSCALTIAGGVKCWGSDSNGQLGDDASLVGQPTPVNVQGLTLGVASISVGYLHACAVLTAGGTKCWGYNGHGQLGDNSTSQKPTPVSVQGLTSGVSSVFAGGYHTCAVTTSGGLKCWGWDSSGQLGDNATIADKPTPVDVLGLTSGVASVSAGYTHTCAVTTVGGLKCWGWNAYGQLGNNSATNASTPVDVLGLASDVISVSAGWNHTCAVTTAGPKCWGYNNVGQLGDNSATDKPTPVYVAP